MSKKDITLLSIRTRFGEARCERTSNLIQYVLFHPSHPYGKVMKVVHLDPSIPLDTHRDRFREWVKNDLERRKFINWRGM